MTLPNDPVQDHAERLERFLNSRLAVDMERNLSRNNPAFADLDSKQKAAALYLIHLGREDLIEDLWRLLYWRKPLRIEEFLTAGVIGYGATTMFPKWQEELLDAFKSGSRVMEMIFGGGIGSGKTTIAQYAHLYNLSRLTCLRDPQLAMGSNPDKPMQLSLFSVTLNKAAEVTMDPFVSMMKSCTLFEECGDEAEFRAYNREATGKVPFWYRRSKEEIFLPKNVFIRSGSQTIHALGTDLFGALLDEAEFRIGGIDQAFEVYANLKHRVSNRFGGQRFTLLTLVSSAREEEGVIPQYTASIKPGDPMSRVYSYAIWDIRRLEAFRNFPRSDYFWVMQGTTVHPHRILSERDAELHERGLFRVPPGCSVIKVPTFYRKDFELNIVKGLQDLAGLRVVGGEKPFDDLSRTETDWLIPEFEIPCSISDPTPLFQKLPKTLFQNTPTGLRLVRYPLARRYIHVDLAEDPSSEAGITMLHKELGPGKTVHFVVDFHAYITAPDRIHIDKIRDLPVDLRSKAGVLFGVLSSDQYQSSSMRQHWEQKKTAPKIELISVDTKAENYRQFSDIVTTGRFHCGRAPKLLAQLRNLRIGLISGRGKEPKPYAKNKNVRKDLADSACGAVTGALYEIADVPTYYWQETESKGPASALEEASGLDEWEEA